MARETTGSIHIGSIAVDISGVRDAFQEIREMAQTLRDDMSQTLTLSANSTDKERQDFLANLGLNDDSIDKAKEKIRLLFEYIGNTGKVQIKAKDGELFQAIVTSADKAKKEVYDLTEALGQFQDKEISPKSAEVTFDYDKQTKEIEKQVNALKNLSLSYSELQKKIDSVNMSGANYTTFSESIKTAQTDIEGLIQKLQAGEVSADGAGRAIQEFQRGLRKIKSEATAAKAIQKQLDDIAKAAEKAAKSADKFDLSKLNKRGRKELASLKKEFDELAASIRNGTETNIPQAKQRLEELQAAMERVTTSAGTTTGAFQKFTNALADKAKWYAAFQVVNTIERAFGQTINVIKNTEDSVVELKRVLNENVSSTAISDALYDIAYRYGQTFDAVQESAVLFAQTGKSWQETLAATEATMLALNTAELDTTQATSGLIAVMSQFKIEADDLEVVIDKINKTADNFPVTSEKIVSALQRTGATAHTAGMSLEETIATITALSEATGRSGENIGTALNSLIQYSQKSKSLEVFSGISENMEKTVQAYKSGAINILNVWEELGKEIDTLTKQQQEALFNTEEYKEFADTLESEASEYTDSIKEIYQTAGTYRQTYFISLLNNIGTITEAMENMAGAEGYSLRENETAMDTLTHRYNQLVASLQELAVQIGNSGLLDALKSLVDGAASFFKGVSNWKQLVPILWEISSILVIIRAQAIGDWFSTKIKNVITNVKGLISVIRGLSTAQATAATTASMLVTAIGGLTLVISVIGAIVNVFKAMAEHAREARQEIIQLGKDASESGKDLGELYSQYRGAATGSEQQKGFTEQLLEESGISTKDIEKRIALRKRETGVVIDASQALQELLDIELQEKAIALEEANEAKIKAIKDEIEARKELDDVISRMRGKAQNLSLGEDYVSLYNTMTGFADTLTAIPQSIEEVNSYIEILTNSLTELYDKEEKTGQELISNEDVAQIQSLIEYYQKLSDEYAENKAQAILMRAGIVAYTDALEEAKKENDAVVDAIMEATGATQEQAQAIKDAEEAIEQYKEAIDSLIDKTKDMENSYDKVVKAIKEYNETGKITADTLRDIVKLGPEYMELLEFEGNQAKINEEALAKLNEQYQAEINNLYEASAQSNNYQMVLDAVLNSTNNLASSQANAAIITGNYSGKVATLTTNYMNGSISAGNYKAQLYALGVQMGLTAREAATLANNVFRANQNMGNFMRNMGSPWNFSGYSNTSGGGGGGGGGGGKAKTAAEILEEKIQELKKVYDEEVDAIEHQIFLGEKHKMSAEDTIAYYRQLQEKAHKQAEKYRALGVAENSKYLIELSKAWFSYQDDIEDLLEGEYEKQINEYKNALNLLEHYYDAAEARFDVDTMQSNLKAQISVQQRIMQAAYDEYVRLINKGKDANDDAVQDAIDTYYDAAEEIRDINSKIADNILGLYDDFIDLADSLDVWDRLNFTKVEYLEEKLHEINRLYKDGTILLKEYKDLLEDTAVDYYNARKAALEKQQEDIETERDSIIESYNAEIENLKKRKEESDNYYDGLIENLRKVSEDYDRINQQLDYYANRQKIITNLEQAQARSGIEWREKEMQYQQQLLELDESWRRTQEDWSISDQIAELERLKEQAASDIEASIERIQAYITAAKNTAAASIRDIQNEVDELKYKIYDAITKAMQGSVENAATAIGGTMAEITQDAEQAANDSQNAWQQEFAEPIKAEIVAIGQMMKDQLVDDGTITAKNLADVFRQYFISPIKTEINSLMSDVTANKSKTSGVAKTSNSVYNNKNTANIYANINNTTTANSFLNGWDRGFFLSPIKYYSSK